MRLRIPLFVLALAFAALMVACGGDDDGPAAAPGTATSGTSANGGMPAKVVTLRLGYFPNITHAQALVGVKDGWFARELGSNVKLEAKTFNAGPAAIEALFAGAIDAADRLADLVLRVAGVIPR